MGFAKLAITDQLLAQMWVTGNKAEYRIESGLPSGAEVVAARYVPTFGRVYIGLKHPEFYSEWRDDLASLPSVDIMMARLDPMPKAAAAVEELCQWDGFYQWWHTTLSEQNRANVLHDLALAMGNA